MNQEHNGGESQVDLEADALCNDVHSSIMRAIDSTRQMPLSEHVLYSSYESYDNLMVEQRRTLDEMMSKLSACSDRRSNQQGSSSAQQQSHGLASRNGTVGHKFDTFENLIDKYDLIHDFNECMFDKIGQNLDDAAGETSRNQQLVQAVVQAANQKNKTLHSSQPRVNRSSKSSMNAAQSSSTTSTKSQQSETNIVSNESSVAQHHQNQYLYKKPQTKVASFNQVNSVVQSSPSIQSRNQVSGGYLGKQQYNNASNNRRFTMLENKNIPRPQNKFRDKIDNSYRPFEPLIKEKPNAQSPLQLCVERDEHGNEYYTHPYESEILKFPIREDLLVQSEPIIPPDLDETPITLVETVEQLEEMCSHIENQPEFAVDVEHHSYRSFQGITCLLQISTRHQDFVIDAIKLRYELYRLNNSFTNPDIVKVFHGADCDVLWLQRDFGVYVVNLFDTSRAAKSMKFAHLSLAFLMKHYCNEDPDKSYQLADWRERPLPLPMLQYARADTHYLLYIYDKLRNDLLEKGGKDKKIGKELLRNVYERGREISLKRYEKPPFTETSHLSVLRKSRSTFNAKQMYAFKELYAWRDSISRELDESVGYVLPNNLMIRISEYLPREPQGITALCNPAPPTVKKYLSDIHAIILKAIDVPLDETTKILAGNNFNLDPSLRSLDLDAINHKQDIAHSAGMQETSVPNLLDRMYSLNCSNDESFNGSDLKNGQRKLNLNNSPSRLYNFLDASWKREKKNSPCLGQAGVSESKQNEFISPYNRYVARNKNN